MYALSCAVLLDISAITGGLFSPPNQIFFSYQANFSMLPSICFLEA